MSTSTSSSPSSSGFDVRIDTASARTDVQALHVLKDGDSAMFTLWATYLTDFVRSGDGWKIARHELVIRGTQQTP